MAFSGTTAAGEFANSVHDAGYTNHLLVAGNIVGKGILAFATKGIQYAMIEPLNPVTALLKSTAYCTAAFIATDFTDNLVDKLAEVRDYSPFKRRAFKIIAGTLMCAAAEAALASAALPALGTGALLYGTKRLAQFSLEVMVESMFLAYSRGK